MGNRNEELNTFLHEILHSKAELLCPRLTLAIFQPPAYYDLGSWLYYIVRLSGTKVPSRHSIPRRLPPISPVLSVFSPGATKFSDSIRRQTWKTFALTLNYWLTFNFLQLIRDILICQEVQTLLSTQQLQFCHIISYRGCCSFRRPQNHSIFQHWNTWKIEVPCFQQYRLFPQIYNTKLWYKKGQIKVLLNCNPFPSTPSVPHSHTYIGGSLSLSKRNECS